MKTKILVTVLYLIGGLTAYATTYKFSPDRGKITFLARGTPALISIKGKGEGATAALTKKEQMLNGEISFQLKSLKTGIELRDEHLKTKYLEVDKYPIATLKISNLILPEDLKDEFSFNGILNLHGVDQPVAGLASVMSDSKLQDNYQQSQMAAQPTEGKDLVSSVLSFGYQAKKGLLPHVVAEHLQQDLDDNSAQQSSAGIGVQWLPIPHVETQAEFKKLTCQNSQAAQGDSGWFLFHIYL